MVCSKQFALQKCVEFQANVGTRITTHTSHHDFDVVVQSMQHFRMHDKYTPVRGTQSKSTLDRRHALKKQMTVLRTPKQYCTWHVCSIFEISEFEICCLSPIHASISIYVVENLLILSIAQTHHFFGGVFICPFQWRCWRAFHDALK